MAQHTRLRRTATVAAITASALVAPLVYNGPASTHAATSTPSVETLINHPEWLLSASDPEVARQVADLQRVLVEHGQTYKAISAYRVPTVDGFVTYVTQSPHLMTVARNPGLIERTPDGTTTLDTETVLARLLNADTDGGGIGIPSVSLWYDYRDLINRLPSGDDIQPPSPAKLIASVERIVADAGQDATVVLAQLQATVTQAVIAGQVLAAKLLEDALVILGSLPTTDELVQAVLAAAGPTLTTVEALQQAVLTAIESLDLLGQIGDIVSKVPTDPAAALAMVQALVDEYTEPLPPIDPLVLLLEFQAIATAQADPVLTAAGLPETAELDPAALVYDVVPLATGSLPVSSGVTPTDPFAHPVTEPIDGPVGFVPQAEAIYGPDEDKPSWNRNNDDCFLAEGEAWWRYVCWNIDNQIYDDSADTTYWQFNMEASSYPKQKRGMFYVWVEGIPNEGSAAQKFDGNLPVPNQTVGGDSGCASTTDSVSLSGGKPVQVGYSYSYSITTCETYTPKGYSDAGHWSNKWNYNVDRTEYGVGYGKSGTHMRNVAFTMGVKTSANAGGVVWKLLSGTRVTKKYCC